MLKDLPIKKTASNPGKIICIDKKSDLDKYKKELIKPKSEFSFFISFTGKENGAINIQEAFFCCKNDRSFCHS